MDEAKSASLRRLMRREWGISLWLSRLLACLQYLCGEPAYQRFQTLFDARLKSVSRAIMAIMLCHAEARVNLPRRKRRFRDPRLGPLSIQMRAAFGAELRRAFKASTFQGRLEKLRLALENRDKLIARLERRLRRGLTRAGFALTRGTICALGLCSLGLCGPGLCGQGHDASAPAPGAACLCAAQPDTS